MEVERIDATPEHAVLVEHESYRCITNSNTLGTGNKLSSWGTNGTVSYADAGNVTNITYQDGRSLDIAWNDRYEMTSVSTNGTTLESYEYDALGRLVKIENSASTNYLVYDGIHVVAEVDASGNLQRSYTYGPSVDDILAMTDHTSTQTYFFVKDHLGSVVAVVDETGTNIVERYEYDAWGNVTAYDADDVEIDESQIGNRYLWQGREYSWTTGLYNFRARWYDAVTGRWLSKDPIGISGGLNQYVFCGDNGVNVVDPSGTRIRLMGNRAERDYILRLLDRFIYGVLSVDEEGYLTRGASVDDGCVEDDMDSLIECDATFKIFSHKKPGGWEQGEFVDSGDGGSVYFSPKVHMNYRSGAIQESPMTPEGLLAHELLGRALQHYSGDRDRGELGTRKRDKYNMRAVNSANRAFIRLGIPKRTAY